MIVFATCYVLAYKTWSFIIKAYLSDDEGLVIRIGIITFDLTKGPYLSTRQYFKKELWWK